MIDVQHIEQKDLNLKGMDKTGYKGVYQLIVKRIMDICLGLIALPFIMLIFIPVGILIKVEDQGPVIYKAKRIGKDFKEFDMYKFRSMKVNAPKIMNSDGSTFNSKNDERVTKIGRIIRETSIDELPQIYNVLKGDMSFIGPRAGDVIGLGSYSDAEKDKTLVRPGITGYTQAYYRNSIGVSEKRLYDAWYAHNVSFALDIIILFKTVSTVLGHKNLYTN